MKKLTRKQLIAFNRKRRASGNKRPLAVDSCVYVGGKSAAAFPYGEICRTPDGYFFAPSRHDAYLPRSERKARARENSARIKRGVWVVYTGRPSWHQQRAGHTYSGAMVFTGEGAEAKAQEYVKNYLKHHPDEPAVLQQERRRS